MALENHLESSQALAAAQNSMASNIVHTSVWESTKVSSIVDKYNTLKSKITTSIADGELSQNEYDQLIAQLDSLHTSITVLTSIEDGGYISAGSISSIVQGIDGVFSFLGVGPIGDNEKAKLAEYKTWLNTVKTNKDYPDYIKTLANNLYNLIISIADDNTITKSEYDSLTVSIDQIKDALNTYLEAQKYTKSLKTQIEASLNTLELSITKLEKGAISPKQLVEFIAQISNLINKTKTASSWSNVPDTDKTSISESFKNIVKAIIDAVYTNDENGDDGTCTDPRYVSINSCTNDLGQIGTIINNWCDKSNLSKSSIEISVNGSNEYSWNFSKSTKPSGTNYQQSDLEFNDKELLDIKSRFYALESHVNSVLEANAQYKSINDALETFKSSIGNVDILKELLSNAQVVKASPELLEKIMIQINSIQANIKNSLTDESNVTQTALRSKLQNIIKETQDAILYNESDMVHFEMVALNNGQYTLQQHDDTITYKDEHDGQIITHTTHKSIITYYQEESHSTKVTSKTPYFKVLKTVSIPDCGEREVETTISATEAQSILNKIENFIMSVEILVDATNQNSSVISAFYKSLGDLAASGLTGETNKETGLPEWNDNTILDGATVEKFQSYVNDLTSNMSDNVKQNELLNRVLQDFTTMLTNNTGEKLRLALYQQIIGAISNINRIITMCISDYDLQQHYTTELESLDAKIANSTDVNSLKTKLSDWGKDLKDAAISGADVTGSINKFKEQFAQELSNTYLTQTASEELKRKLDKALEDGELTADEIAELKAAYELEVKVATFMNMKSYLVKINSMLADQDISTAESSMLDDLSSHGTMTDWAVESSNKHKDGNSLVDSIVKLMIVANDVNNQDYKNIFNKDYHYNTYYYRADLPIVQDTRFEGCSIVYVNNQGICTGTVSSNNYVTAEESTINLHAALNKCLTCLYAIRVAKGSELKDHITTEEYSQWYGGPYTLALKIFDQVLKEIDPDRKYSAATDTLDSISAMCADGVISAEEDEQIKSLIDGLPSSVQADIARLYESISADGVITTGEHNALLEAIAKAQRSLLDTAKKYSVEYANEQLQNLENVYGSSLVDINKEINITKAKTQVGPINGEMLGTLLATLSDIADNINTSMGATTVEKINEDDKKLMMQYANHIEHLYEEAIKNAVMANYIGSTSYNITYTTFDTWKTSNRINILVNNVDKGYLDCATGQVDFFTTNTEMNTIYVRPTAIPRQSYISIQNSTVQPSSPIYTTVYTTPQK